MNELDKTRELIKKIADWDDPKTAICDFFNCEDAEIGQWISILPSANGFWRYLDNDEIKRLYDNN
jgi:hypothetical protein